MRCARGGPGTLLVTSLRREEAPGQAVEMLAVATGGAWLVSLPLLPISVNGAGDAVAALFFAHMLRGGDAARALDLAAASIQAVLEATLASGQREIQLIAAQDELVSPTRRFAVTQVR